MKSSAPKNRRLDKVMETAANLKRKNDDYVAMLPNFYYLVLGERIKLNQEKGML